MATNKLFESTKEMINTGLILKRGLRSKIIRQDDGNREAFDLEMMQRKERAKKSSVKVDSSYYNGYYKKVKMYELRKDFMDKTNVDVGETTFSNWYNGEINNIPSSTLFKKLKKYLGYNYNIEMIFLDPEHEVEYEHKLFFEVVENFRKRVQETITNEGSDSEQYQQTTSSFIIDKVLSHYKGSLESADVVKIIKILWNQFDKAPQMKKNTQVIMEFESNPLIYSKGQRIGAINTRLDFIVDFYFVLFKEDNSSKFDLKGKRFRRYNQIEELTSGKIQKACLKNVLTYVEMVSATIAYFEKNPICYSDKVPATHPFQDFAKILNKQLLENDSK